MKKMKMDKKGEFITQVMPFILILLIIGIVVSIVVSFSANTRDLLIDSGNTVSNETNLEFQALNNTIGTSYNLTENLPTFGLILGLFLFIALMLMLVKGRMS